MKAPVVWLNFNEDAPNRGYWDQGLLEDLFSGDLWNAAGAWEYEHAEVLGPAYTHAIVVVPGRQNAEHVEKLNGALATLQGVLLIVTGDEEGEFPIEQVSHPNLRAWVMTPQPNRDYPDWVVRFIGTGYPPGLREYYRKTYTSKAVEVFFSGQVTHSRREECVKYMKEYAAKERDYDSDQYWRGCVEVHETPGFIQGMDQELYWNQMQGSHVCPAPGGPVSPDSFRFFEALEAGSVPIADNRSGRDSHPEMWEKIFGATWFPRVSSWADLERQLGFIADDPMFRNRVFARWQQYKRELAYSLRDDFDAVSGWGRRNADMRDRTTVLMPTSPCPFHPSTEIIDETIKSIRETAGLEDVEIIVMIDGVREKDEGHRKEYTEYITKLLGHLNTLEHNVVPVIFDEHKHQGVMTRTCLDMVDTDTILFVEHDAPLVGDFEWGGLYEALTTPDQNRASKYNLIRFHHEAQILDVHLYLMHGDEPEEINGIRVWPTGQWSQRPHLARTDVYRDWMQRYFGWESRTMIEDVMNTVVESSFMELAWSGWDMYRLGIYCPTSGINMKRSTHLDARGDWEKGSMVVAYDQDQTPKFAPHHGKVIDG